jgi:antibiotic biosynthesis monooxygenase (ABM) superfamily enzyme
MPREERDMDRRTKICIWVILIGLGNFLAYTIIYMFLGGEAVSGWIEVTGHDRTYFLHWGQQVSKGVYLYSGIHSISIWLTVAAIMLAMLTLAKERIVSSMHSTIVRGRTFITILATVITFMTVIITIWFVLKFVENFNHPRTVPPAIRKSASQPASGPLSARPSDPTHGADN